MPTNRIAFCDTGSSYFANGFGWLACIVMLTRTAFHLLWLLTVLGAVLPLLSPSRRRVLLTTCVAPIIVVAVCYANTWWRTGIYGPSSWIGMNLAKGWEIRDAEVTELGDARVAHVVRRNGRHEPCVDAKLGERRGNVCLGAAERGLEHRRLEQPLEAGRLETKHDFA